MIPVRDINPTRTTPFVNYALIALNVFAFLWVKSLPSWYEAGYGLIPTRLVADPDGEAFTILTSMFMHANLSHILGNMVFLYIFGDNIEDAIGHARYLAFYVASGFAAAFAQIGIDPASTIPMVGASGAIAGVTAGYLVLYPRAPILVLNPIPPLWLVFGLFLTVPAWLIAGEFFIMNLYMGVRSLGETSQGGVAFWAHLGGFLGGLGLIFPAMRGRRRQRRKRWDGWQPPPGRGPRGGGRSPWAR